MPLVGWILVIMALFSVGAVLFMVVREHVETEEAYNPQTSSANEQKQAEGSGE